MKREIQIKITCAKKGPLHGVNSAGIRVSLFGQHSGFPRVEECVEVKSFVASLDGSPGLFHSRCPDATETRGFFTGAVHDYGIIVEELAEGAQPVALGLIDGGIEIGSIPLMVLGLAEFQVFSGRLPIALEGFPEAGRR